MITPSRPFSTKDGDAASFRVVFPAELLRMIERDHRIRYASACDVRDLGTRMRRWMDADIQRRLEYCWASFDLEDSRRALRASVDLFVEVASRIAEAADLVDFRHEAARVEIEIILERPGPGQR